MDFDPEKFDRNEIEDHLTQIGVLPEHDFDKLLERTTKSTRRGTEFSFKPIELSIGTHKGDSFVAGQSFDLERKGIDPHKPGSKELQSSFWFRLHHSEEWFQLRTFCAGHDEPVFQPYNCRIPFRDVERLHLHAEYPVVVGTERRVRTQLFIYSRKPPKYCYYLQDISTVGAEPIFERHATEADFFATSYAEPESEAGGIYAVGDPRGLVNPGLHLVHRLVFNLTVRHYKLIWLCTVCLRLANVETSISAHDPVLLRQPQTHWRSLINAPNLTFAMRYAIGALLTQGNLTIMEVEDLLISIRRYKDDVQLRILEALPRWVRKGQIAQDIRGVARNLSPPSALPEHLIPVRRCLVTPTRCILQPPVPETSNSVLRAFITYIDRFLRVQFVDDDGGFPVNGETAVIDDMMQGTEGVYARIRRALRYGILIADRVYRPLAFSESQAKERGYWFIAEEGDFTVDAVLEWMGDLSEEKIIAKNAARRSLPLSITRQLEIEIDVTFKPDISRWSGDGRLYVFTDGVCVCHPDLIKQYAQQTGYNGTLSAIQIRIGGIKGVLCSADPQTARTMSSNTVWVRPSQEKFATPHRTLHVVKPASFSRATLNRQSILLLEALGVPTATLVDIFLAEKSRLEDLEHTFNRASLSVICTFPVADALATGIQDPLLENVLRVTKCRMLSDLRWKAWIEIPQSVFLMGVADETGSLAEGEIFCQQCPPGGSSEVITGRCTIYRNPCLHPGDVRPVKAVDCEHLKHLKNVIVFSTKGDRPLPNMLAGGDLDGDLYTLLWDPRLQVSEDQVHEPMDYTPPEPRRTEGVVTQEQVQQHFIDTIKNDTLGRVCNAHMAFADKLDPRSPECLELARLASQAVDFPKTGVPVSQQSIPKVGEYPDFMGKDYKSIRVFKKQAIKSYKSENALGQMFRSIDPEPAFDEVENIVGDPVLCDIAIPPMYTRYLCAAALHKARYDFQLVSLLRRYNISEAECVAGVLLRSPKVRFKVERDYDLRLALREAFKVVVTSSKAQVESYLKEQSVTNDLDDDRHAWALAAYQITYNPSYREYLKIDWSLVDLDITDEEETELRDEFADAGFEERKYFSFAWLFPKELFSLRQGQFIL